MSGMQDRICAEETWVSWEGAPYVDPTSGRAGGFIDECLTLNEAQLEELCNYWEWRSEQATRDVDAWWCWTVVRFGRSLLSVRRGHHPPPRRIAS